MKTIEFLKSEINAIVPVSEEKDKKTFTANNKKAKFLRDCILYLEKSPTEFFIKSEIDRMDYKIECIDNGFYGWKCPDNCKNPRAAYNTKAGLAEVKRLKRTLLYLISNS